MAQSVTGFLTTLKSQAADQKNYGETPASEKPTAPKTEALVCPNCGAGRAKEDGLTHCAYCGYRFIDVELSDGIYLTKEDNSRHD